jgi:hypothetical protein
VVVRERLEAMEYHVESIFTIQKYEEPRNYYGIISQQSPDF